LYRAKYGFIVFGHFNIEEAFPAYDVRGKKKWFYAVEDWNIKGA
jgi:hypothetical protein